MSQNTKYTLIFANTFSRPHEYLVCDVLEKLNRQVSMLHWNSEAEPNWYDVNLEQRSRDYIKVFLNTIISSITVIQPFIRTSFIILRGPNNFKFNSF